MCTIEELMPAIGSSVPTPSVLSVVICQSESTIQSVGKLCSDSPNCSTPDMDFDNPFDFYDDALPLYKTRLISISDDGKVWSWILTAEGAGDTQKNIKNSDVVDDSAEKPLQRTNTNPLSSSNKGVVEGSRQLANVTEGRRPLLNSTFNLADLTFKVGYIIPLSICIFSGFFSSHFSLRTIVLFMPPKYKHPHTWA